MKKHTKFKENVVVEKKSNKTTYIAIFFATIMVFSVLSVFFQNPTQDTEYTYGKYAFKSISTTGQWSTKINGKETLFYFLPAQISNMEIPVDVIPLIKNSQATIIAFNPEINESNKLQVVDLFRYDVGIAFSQKFPEKQLGYAVTKSTTAYALPELSCVNASYYMPIMVLDYSNETKIISENSCIKISALTEYDLLQIMDYLKYSIYGVLDEEAKE